MHRRPAQVRDDRGNAGEQASLLGFHKDAKRTGVGYLVQVSDPPCQPVVQNQQASRVSRRQGDGFRFACPKIHDYRQQANITERLYLQPIQRIQLRDSNALLRASPRSSS